VTRRIVLLRHGRTEWNATRRIQGQLDPGLDETGHQQARAVAPAVAKLDPAVLWSSDLVRARETVAYVADETGLGVTYDARLREFHVGNVQGLTHEELAAQDAGEYARFRAGDWDAIPGAETRAQVAERVSAALVDLAAALAPGETGVAVAHGAAIRTGAVAWLGWPPDHAWDLRALGNCAWLELVERPSGRWALLAYNRTA